MGKLDPPHILQSEHLKALHLALREWARSIEQEADVDLPEKPPAADPPEEHDKWVVRVLLTPTDNVITLNSVMQLRRLVEKGRGSGTVESKYLSVETTDRLVAIVNENRPDHSLRPCGVEKHHATLEELCNEHPAFKGKIVTWDQSGDWESRSEEVMCLTNDMTWATTHLDDILKSLHDHYESDKIHRYIVAQDSWTERTVVRILKRADSTVRNDEYFDSDKDVVSRLQIKRLSNHDPEHCIPGFAALPLPSDIVLYRNFMTEDDFLRSAVVMSAYPVRHPITEIQKKNYFDFILSSGDYRTRFATWFELAWNNIKVEPYYNGRTVV